MSRLVNLLTPSAPLTVKLSDTPLAAGHGSDAALVNFQALFAQEMSGQSSGETPLQALTEATTGRGHRDEKAGAGDDASAAQPLLAWLPLTEAPARAPDAALGANVAAGNGKFLSATLAPFVSAASKNGNTLAEAKAGTKATPIDAALPFAQDMKEALKAAENVAAQSTPVSTRSAESATTAATAQTTLPEMAAVVTPQVSKPRDMLNPGQVAMTLQQAVSTQNLTSLRPPEVAAPFGAKEWQQDFTQQVTLIAKQDLGSAEIKLNPPQLGPVEVSITIKNDQAQASFASPHAPVRDAIEASLPRLREMLAEVGITLGNANVSPDLAQAQSAFAGFDRNGQRAAQNAAAEAKRNGGAAETVVTTVVSRRTLGRVDTFA